ncbi:MAG TPA: DUF3617 domain-containing protein [Rhizomicrobium sp.]|nr:DUF3617 domain-containing protein [Rhizomicrobium sp.]
MFSRYVVFLAAAAAVSLLPASAQAGHSRSGLWSTTATTTMTGMDPQTQTATFCMTPEQAGSEGPPGGTTPGCTISNAHMDGRTYSADMVCTGQFNATGSISATYDSDTHYSATTSLVTNGVRMTTHSDSRWLKPDCAGAEH